MLREFCQGQEHSLGQGRGRPYFMVALEHWMIQTCIPPQVYHIQIIANWWGTFSRYARHYSQHFPPVTHTVILTVYRLILSTHKGKSEARQPGSRAHALDLDAMQSLYTRPIIPGIYLPLPPGPFKSKGHTLLIFTSSEPITIPDTRWAFKRASLNGWTELSVAR